MRKTFLLCFVSGLFGALFAIALYDPPDAELTTIAQETEDWVPTRAADVVGVAVAAPATETPGYDNLTPDEKLNVQIYENGNRSAVNINTRSVQTDFFLREQTSEGEGSGTVIDKKGHILTNWHVVDRVSAVQVTLFNGETYQASLVGGDTPTDVAILKIDAPADSLHPVAFGDSGNLLVGQKVFAIGNPFGLERTLSTGVVSSLNRSMRGQRSARPLKSLIQIDASINPGNSGGPLLDTRGQMIGMNTAIASTTGDSAGVGFAIPVNAIARIVPALIRDGRIIRADIGIARVLRTDHGLLISRLVPDGAAERAGLQGPKVITRQSRRGSMVYQYRTIDNWAADLITAIDGTPVRSADKLLDLVESKKPGEEVVVTVIRDRKEKKQIPVKLDAEE